MFHNVNTVDTTDLSHLACELNVTWKRNIYGIVTVDWQISNPTSSSLSSNIVLVFCLPNVPPLNKSEPSESSPLPNKSEIIKIP